LPSHVDSSSEEGCAAAVESSGGVEDAMAGCGNEFSQTESSHFLSPSTISDMNML
jgi:hypothetical protein